MKSIWLLLSLVVCLCVANALCEDYLVGAWNIQVFGDSKMSDSNVVDVLVSVLTRYDLVLIQEIRDAQEEAIYQLLTLLQAEQSAYQMLLSPRLGRTNSKEQYAYIYRSDKFAVEDSYTYSDSSDDFEREPFVAQFRTLSGGYIFSLIGCHIKPDDAVDELNKMPDVYTNSFSILAEDNALLLGDFNADCSYVTSSDWANIDLFTDPFYNWVIDIDSTTSASNCAYDRLVLTDPMMSAMVEGSPSVYYFDQALQLSPSLTLDVSDHYPVELTLRVDGGSAEPAWEVFYLEDFEEAVSGTVWSDTSRDTTPTGSRGFLGQFSLAQSVEFSIPNVPGSISASAWQLEMEIFVIRSWNGDAPWGPDVFTVSVNGQQLLHTGFCNTPLESGDNQAYPDSLMDPSVRADTCKQGAQENNTLGYLHQTEDFPQDSVYLFVANFTYSSGPLTVQITGSTQGTPEPIENESFGIDNFKISYYGLNAAATPSPSPSPSRQLASSPSRTPSRSPTSNQPPAFVSLLLDLFDLFQYGDYWYYYFSDKSVNNNGLTEERQVEKMQTLQRMVEALDEQKLMEVLQIQIAGILSLPTSQVIIRDYSVNQDSGAVSVALTLPSISALDLERLIDQDSFLIHNTLLSFTVSINVELESSMESSNDSSNGFPPFFSRGSSGSDSRDFSSSNNSGSAARLPSVCLLIFSLCLMFTLNQ